MQESSPSGTTRSSGYRAVYRKRPDTIGEFSVGCSFTEVMSRPLGPSCRFQSPYTAGWMTMRQIGRIRRQYPTVFDTGLSGDNFGWGNHPSGPGKIRLSHQRIETRLTLAWI
jgi:hypothetical protein